VSCRNEISSDSLVNICAGKYNLDEKNMLFILFLGAFTKMRKASVSFTRLSIRPSVCLHKAIQPPPDGFT
jgi:hypothetical protein